LSARVKGIFVKRELFEVCTSVNSLFGLTISVANMPGPQLNQLAYHKANRDRKLHLLIRRVIKGLIILKLIAREEMKRNIPLHFCAQIKQKLSRAVLCHAIEKNKTN